MLFLCNESVCRIWVLGFGELMTSDFADEFNSALDPVFNGGQLGYRVLPRRAMGSSVQQREQAHNIGDIGVCKAFKSVICLSLPLE